MINVSRVTKSYEHHRVLDKVSLSAQDGLVTGVVGPLGAGASTLLRIVTGTVRADEGTVTFDSTALVDTPDPTVALGAFLGSQHIPERLTPRSFLKYVRALVGAPRSRVGELLDLADLTHVPDQLVKDLSPSQRQRLGIAAATAGHPQHLVLDEPLAGLEPGDVGWVQALLREHADRGGTVLLSSSHLDAVAPLVGHVVELDRGRVLREGAVSTFLAPGTPRTYVESDDVTTPDLLEAQGWLVERSGNGGSWTARMPNRSGRCCSREAPARPRSANWGGPATAGASTRPTPSAPCAPPPGRREVSVHSFDPDDTTSFPAIQVGIADAVPVDRTVASPRGPQDVVRVWRAHLVRLLGQGGLRGTLAAVTAAGTVVGMAAIPVLSHLLDDRPAIDVAVRCADTAALVVAVGWCLAVVLDTAHGSTDGTRLMTAMAVPARRRQLFTHAAAAATLGAAAAAAVSLATGTAAGAALLDGATDAWSGRLLVGTSTAALSTAMLAAMAVAIGSLTRPPALALLALLVWWIAVPTMLNAVGTLLPDDATAVATTLAHLFPSTMGGRTVTGDDTTAALMANQIGLVAWTGALLWLADIIEERRDLL